MQSQIVFLHRWPALAAADLGTGQPQTHELPKNYAYLSLILQKVAIVLTTVVPPARTEDGQHRMFTRMQLKRDGNTPFDVSSRDFGLFEEYLYGVLDDVQETTPLVIGANTMESVMEFPLVDPTVPDASPQWAETILVGWRRKNLEFRITPPGAVTDMYTAAGGTIALTSLTYALFARVIKDPTANEVAQMGGLDKELRFASKAEATALATPREYGVYRDTNLERDVRFLKLASLLTDAGARGADLLTEATLKVGGEFVLPENFDADVLKSINVRDRDFDQVDGFWVLNTDQNHDHVTAPFASEGAVCEYWRTQIAGVGAVSNATCQMSVGAADYSDMDRGGRKG